MVKGSAGLGGDLTDGPAANQVTRALEGVGQPARSADLLAGAPAASAESIESALANRPSRTTHIPRSPGGQGTLAPPGRASDPSPLAGHGSAAGRRGLRLPPPALDRAG